MKTMIKQNEYRRQIPTAFPSLGCQELENISQIYRLRKLSFLARTRSSAHSVKLSLGPSQLSAGFSPSSCPLCPLPLSSVTDLNRNLNLQTGPSLLSANYTHSFRNPPAVELLGICPKELKAGSPTRSFPQYTGFLLCSPLEGILFEGFPILCWRLREALYQCLRMARTLPSNNLSF